MLIPSVKGGVLSKSPSLSRRVNANSQRSSRVMRGQVKLIKKGEC